MNSTNGGKGMVQGTHTFTERTWGFVMVSIVFALIRFIRSLHRNTKTWHIHTHTQILLHTQRHSQAYPLLLTTSHTHDDVGHIENHNNDDNVFWFFFYVQKALKSKVKRRKKKKTKKNNKALKHKVHWSKYYRFLLSIPFILYNNTTATAAAQ